MADRLGRRTAQMHLALAANRRDENFAPEPFSHLYQRAVFQAMQNLVSSEFRLLKKSLTGLEESVRAEAEEALGLKKRVVDLMRGITKGKFNAVKTRIHGDYHLGQVLFTGKDFVIFDFEGEPARTLSERRLKRSPVRDVAGMLRSFHYAAYSALFKNGLFSDDQKRFLTPWAELWSAYIGGAFLRGYLFEAASGAIVPDDPAEFEQLLIPYLLEKAIYEMGYELNNRPAWLVIPLRGVKQLCGE
jgi:maltose alpha-D-glucosyltransferase/alpha-amylase